MPCSAPPEPRQADIERWLAQAGGLHAAGDLDGATALYQKILRDRPGHADALLMLGVIAQQAGDPNLALDFIDTALAQHPAFAIAHFNRSVILRTLDRDAEALTAARRALELAPDLAEAWDNAAQLLTAQEDYAEAAGCHHRAVELRPGCAAFYAHYAITLQAAGQGVAAYHAARISERIDPSYPPLTLGNILKSLGYPEAAAARFARARLAHSGLADATASQAMACLQMGDFSQGWRLWERRPDLAPELGALPVWQGQVTGHLLLYEDQGLGDAIQFLRYLPQLANRAGKITLRIAAPLRRLCAANFPGIDLLDANAPPPAADARCRLSSLPLWFDTGLHNIPACPYLAPSFRAALPDNIRAPRIGLVWAGNPQFHNDKNRSLPLAALRPVLQDMETHFVSLQKIRPSGAVLPSTVYDAAPHLDDFAAAAALIAQLDLVVSVDTAVAHLAGALGKPVFILLPFDSDWRWLLGREDSPWYGTARLFRQTAPGGWDAAIQQVAGAVRRLIAGDVSVLQPPQWRGESLRQNPHAVKLTS